VVISPLTEQPVFPEVVRSRDAYDLCGSVPLCSRSPAPRGEDPATAGNPTPSHPGGLMGGLYISRLKAELGTGTLGRFMENHRFLHFSVSVW
jgi:hypothetical protein